jgi:hypothetical protein
MDRINKTDAIAGGGGFVLGGLCSIDLLWSGSAADWVIITLQFIGVLCSALFTACVMVVGKYMGESVVDWLKEYFKQRKIKRNERRSKKAA